MLTKKTLSKRQQLMVLQKIYMGEWKFDESPNKTDGRLKLNGKICDRWYSPVTYMIGVIFGK